jgi:hypothetical protein
MQHAQSFAAFACALDTYVKAPFPAQTRGTANATSCDPECFATTVTPEFSFCEKAAR